MTSPRARDERIDAFFRTAQPDLPDRTFAAVRRQVHATRQVVMVGPVAATAVPRFAGGMVAAAVVLAIGALVIAPRAGLGPGGSASPATAAAPSPSAGGPTAAAPTNEPGPTGFKSPLYGYSVTLPAGSSAAQAYLRWDGERQPGTDADVDKFVGPGELSSFGFAGSFDGTVAALAKDRIAANARDHADTCPNAKPEINEPLEIHGQPWVLLGWRCGALINQALTVRNGVAYAFVFRDLAIDVASDPADRSIFLEILESVELPS